ncbi:hypothetical protein BV22DRAFT_574747 [Leucogyrophana mollusca]|uniref:Uncharacterized protein n=1 Tax=Leucogyrophana mollusca TaxID=85980 RepID=A0ACB8BCW8_9AGAM|nr:hypothetical protein BV22DRAFT_574747 [Leucogyrophana mollusca]
MRKFCVLRLSSVISAPVQVHCIPRFSKTRNHNYSSFSKCALRKRSQYMKNTPDPGPILGPCRALQQCYLYILSPAL